MFQSDIGSRVRTGDVLRLLDERHLALNLNIRQPVDKRPPLR